ncbi:DUF2341 domain-containing protein, partial [Verrucomicrobia bacterium]|nr:DUF2341 domain-containing protein [Verrucomicrobiota bacterium]
MKTRKPNTKSNTNLFSFRWNGNALTKFAAVLIGCGLSFLSSPVLEATVEKGARLQGTKLQDDSTSLKITTHKAIKWSSADLDPSTFEHPSSNPTRLKFKAAGDYFITLTAPVISGTVSNSGRRSTSEFVIFKNGTALPEGPARSTYIRHDTNEYYHTESSGHTAVLLRGISANDYIEIKTKRTHGTNSNETLLGTTTLYSEKVDSSRTIFSGTATRTAAGTNFNGALSGLQWTAGAKDSGFTHSDSSNSHNITLDAAGKYLVFANVPLDGATARASVKMEVKVGGTQVTGGHASQGYLRNGDGIRDASLHWSGLVSTSSANQVLTINLGADAGGSAVTVNGEKATVFIEKLPNTNSVFSASGTQLVTGDNWNPDSESEIKWSTQDTIDASKFTHSTSSNSHKIFVDSAGDYLLIYNDALDGRVTRANPKVQVKVNGVTVDGLVTASHYIRNTSYHFRSSGSIVTVLPGLNANDYVSVGVKREAGGGTVNDHKPAIITLIKKPTIVSPVITTTDPGTSPINATVTFKQDGTNTSVSGFAANDVTLTNATLSDFAGSGHTYTFKVTPTSDPAIVTITIPSGAAGNTGGATKSLTFQRNPTHMSNLIAWWPLNESAGASVAKDWGPNGLDGTITNAGATIGQGRVGSAFYFDGSGDKITIPFSPEIAVDKYTFTFWLKAEINSASWAGVFCRSGRNYCAWIGGSTGNGFVHHRFKMGGNGNNGVDNATGIAPEMWTHVACTNQGNPGVAKSYINGIPVKTKTINDTIYIHPSAPIYIGANDGGGGSWYKGYLQDVRFYSEALSDSEVLAMYNNIDNDWGAPVIDLPTVFPANAGVALSTPITYTIPNPGVSNPTWSATGLPAGVTINQTTGAISGNGSQTPADTGTDHSVVIKAANGYGTGHKSVTFRMYKMPTSITAGSVIDRGLYGATFTGSFADVTATPCKVTVYVDTSDKGTNPGAWGMKFEEPNLSPGAFSRAISGLQPSTNYVFRLSVANAGGSLKWTSSAGNFSTAASVAPPSLGVVSGNGVNNTMNPYPSDIATLTGSISDTGGENPQVYFLWGDEDRGTDYANIDTWDNKVAMGVRGSGSFTINLSGLQKGKLYYCRTAAANGAGSIVSSTIGTFSPTTAGGLSLRNPSQIYPSNNKLWLDANHSSAGSATWTDRSSSTNNATKRGSPTVVSNALNGMPVVRYGGVDGQYHEFPNMTDVRTVFWVLKKAGSRYSNILGDNNRYHMHPDGNYIWSSAHTNGNVKNGNLWLNGVSVVGQSTSKPTSYAVLSFRSAGATEFSNFANDRNIGGRTFQGDLAELLIYNIPLSDAEIQEIEGYLAHKWALTGNLPSDHPWKASSTTPAAPSITSANSATGTVGSAFTYNITTNLNTPLYSAFNLPPGLSENQSTGAITGSPTAGGAYTVNLVAESAPDIATGTVTITIPTSVAVLTASTPSNVVANGAKLLGNVDSTGGNNPTVTIYWGDNDGGTTASNWDSSQSLGAKGSGVLAHDVSSFGSGPTNMTPGSTYYFRFKGVNSAGTSWSATQSFQTAASASAPVLGSTYSASHVTATSAKLNTSLQSTGGASTDFVIFWGDNDGGTTVANWDSNFTFAATAAGNKLGEITSGLSAPNVYYARVRAKNWVGETWASTTLVFSPPAINNTPTKSANLLGWWTFDNDTTTAVADSSGNGYDGVASSANIFKTDTPFGTGKSIDLNGNQYVAVSDGGQQTVFNGANAFSISAWVKEWPDGGWEPYVSKRGEGGQGWQIRRRGGDQDRMSFTLRGVGNDDWYIQRNINDNQWHHIVGTFGQGYRRGYVDGTMTGEEQRFGSVNMTGSQLVFGARDNSGNYNNGLNIGNQANVWLDDVRYYNAPLTANEVSSIYGNGNGDVGQSWIQLTSPLAGQASTGFSFNYQITATNSPTAFYLVNAPSWLGLNQSTGVVSGVPTAGGIFTYRIGAANANGAEIKEFVLTVGDNSAFDYSLDLTTDFNGTFGKADVTMLETGGLTGSSSHPSYPVSKAFDGDTDGTDGNNRWLPYQNGRGGHSGDIFMQWHFKKAFKPITYKLMSQDNTWNKRGPKTFKLQGSNNGSSWTDLDTEASQTGWQRNQLRTFQVDDTNNSYTYIRWLCSAGEQTDNHVGLREIELWGEGEDIKPTLEDFNLLVRLDENNATLRATGFRHGQCGPNGRDLRFQSAAGQELKYEVANWNPTGESQVWVQVPNLSSDKIIMRWGDPNAAAPGYRTDGTAWSTNYFGVYHLEGEPGQPAADSTRFNNHGTAQSGFTNADAGVAGTGHVNAKNTNQAWVATGSDDNATLNDLHVSFWTKMLQDDAQDWQNWWGITHDAGNVRLEADNQNPTSPNFYNAGLSGFQNVDNPSTDLVADEWFQITLATGGGKSRIYVNGIQDGHTRNYAYSNAISGWAIGKGVDRNGPGHTMDEYLFSSGVARNSDWIKASYDSQKPGGSFINYGLFAGPPSFDVLDAEVFAKKGIAMEAYKPSVIGGGTISYSAVGLPPGISINASTGQITGSTDATGNSNFTLTLTGENAAGTAKSSSKAFVFKVSDTSGFPNKLTMTLSGYTGSSSLTDFPVLVELGSSISGFTYNTFSGTGGSDLRFYASNGKELPFEIEDWNTTGVSRVWVKVPAISGNNTQFIACWGDPNLTIAPDYQTNGSTWTNQYLGAWHMSEVLGTYFLDSSPNNYHGTVSGATAGTGIVGKAAVLNGTSDEINLGTQVGNPGSTFTLTAWIKQGSGTGSNGRIFSNKSTATGNMGWGVFRSSNNTRLNVRGSGSSNKYRDVVSSWSAGNWHHISVVIEGTVVKFYADGVYKNNRTNLNLVKPSTNALKIGRSLVNNDKWGGSLDEIRISTEARSLDWIKAAYDNQKATQSLVNYGTVIGPRVITSPLLQDATVGTSFTYNTATVGSPNSYTFLNLPGGLQFNPTTGVITGTPTTSGQFPVVVVVGYADDDGDVTDTDSSPDQIGSLFPPQNSGDADQVILNINVQATAPTVTTVAASSIEATKASFNGNVTSTGGDAPDIRIYYGTTDGASTPSAWSFVEEIGSKDQGAFGAIIGDLIPETAYHYRIRAYNSAASAGVWASSSQTFNTQATTLPVVSNGSLLNATGTAVTFKAGI